MRDSDRLNQLRVMRDRLDRLEASPERDWMLAEVRRRAVDVESEGRAAPLRPRVVEPEPAPRLQPPPVKRAAGRPRLKTQPPAPTPAPRSAVVIQGSTPLPEGLLLCLGEDGLAAPQPAPQGSMVPWARGLRG